MTARAGTGFEPRPVATDGAPGAVGPYAQGTRSGPYVFTSGQIGLDPATGRLVEGGIGPETRRALLNLKAVLSAGGSDFSRVVKATVYLVDLEDFPAMNEVYADMLGDARPARATVGVSALPLQARVEIEMVASAAD